MNTIGYRASARISLLVGALIGIAGTSLATPEINSAVIRERIFNDCPTSVLTSVNNYPSLISIEDTILDCGGFANLHNFRFSTDGANPAAFENDDAFRSAADLTLTGTGDCEAGLQISPWWAQDVDGRLNVRTTDGEIACFGGRLPFFSFTGTFGLHYVKGTTIHLEMIYHANGLTAADPGTIQYIVGYDGSTYDSGVLPFDEGNPAEDPPYGLWGILNDARVGGHFQVFLRAGDPTTAARAEWANIEFEDLKQVPVRESTWGAIKGQYR